jgi:hypothetical protein
VHPVFKAVDRFEPSIGQRMDWGPVSLQRDHPIMLLGC